MSQCLEEYSESGVDALTSAKLDKFLENLDKTYAVAYKDGEIFGLSMRYVSSPFSPLSCMHNILDLMKNNFELKIQIEELEPLNIFSDSMRFSNPINVFQTSLGPYRLIKRLAEERWKSFMPAGTKILLNGEKYNLQEPISSCIRTCFIVSSLYLGKDRARLVKKNLRKKFDCSWSFSISKETKLSYVIKNLFTGVSLSWINRIENGYFLDDEQRNIEMDKAKSVYVNDFFGFMQPIIDQVILKIENREISDEVGIQELEEIINKINYKFNSGVISKLFREICHNNKRVTENQSFLYCIAITSEKKYDHAFNLEQYLSPFTGQTRFRLLQSWINKADLAQDFVNRGYADGDEGTWDLKGVMAFLRYLREVYEPNENRSPSSYFNCFGYEDEINPLTNLIQKNGKKKLYGLSLRYLSFPFSPNDCMQHLSEMMQAISHADMVDQLTEKIG